MFTAVERIAVWIILQYNIKYCLTAFVYLTGNIVKFHYANTLYLKFFKFEEGNILEIILSYHFF